MGRDTGHQASGEALHVPVWGYRLERRVGPEEKAEGELVLSQ